MGRAEFCDAAQVADLGRSTGEEAAMFDLASLFETVFSFEMAKDTSRHRMLRVLDATGKPSVGSGRGRH